MAAGQLCILGDIWNLASGNRLPFVGNRLQGLKMETGCYMASGNRLPIVCNRLHRGDKTLVIDYQLGVIDYTVLPATGNRLPFMCNRLHSVTFSFQYAKAV